MISASTPASFTAGSGPNTRLSRDGVANRFFLAGSMEGLIPNDNRLCDTEDELKTNSWPCHGFEAGYLHDVSARTKIVNDIAALLPTARTTNVVDGRIFFSNGSPVVGASVVISRIPTPPDTGIAQDITDENGFYRISLPDPCISCFMSIFAEGLGGTGHCTVRNFPIDIRGSFHGQNFLLACDL